MEILNDAVLPYIKSMKGSYAMDQARFSQIEFLLDILSDSDKVYNASTQGLESSLLHPAVTCQHIDALIKEINSRPYWTKSSLARSLESAVDKQWRPIVADNRMALQSVGAKLAAIGLVEVVGRPAVMLYPLWLLVQQVLTIVRQIEHKQSISPSTVVAVVKALLLLYVSSYLMALMAAYQGMGYTCLALGGLALSTSVSDSTVKAASPILAPHLTHIDAFIERLQSLEAVAMNAMGAAHTSPAASSRTAPLAPHPQVEVVPEADDSAAASVDSDSEVLVQEAIGTEEDSSQPGLRRRNVGSSAIESPTWRASRDK
jgi:hypothetical protein